MGGLRREETPPSGGLEPSDGMSRQSCMGRAQHVSKAEEPQYSYNRSWLSNLRWWPLMSLTDNEDFCQCLNPPWCWDNDAKPADSQCFYCCPGQSRNEYIHEVLSKIEKVTSVTEEMPKVMLALAKSKSEVAGFECITVTRGYKTIQPPQQPSKWALFRTQSCGMHTTVLKRPSQFSYWIIEKLSIMLRYVFITCFNSLRTGSGDFLFFPFPCFLALQ